MKPLGVDTLTRGADKGWAVKRARPSKKGVMQWTGTLLKNVACFRLRLGLAMWFVH